MPLNSKVFDFLRNLPNFRLPGEFALDLISLCKYLKIETFDMEFNDPQTTGAIIHENSKWTILVKESDITTRKRFTVAHEIGHYISWLNESYSKAQLDKGIHTDLAIARRSNESNEAEWEANEIAGNLLMPVDLVAELYDNKEYSIEGMAKKFGVSATAMTVRLQRLKYDIFED